MVIGPTGSGKTTMYNVLQRSMQGFFKMKINVSLMNPKAVTTGQLFGEQTNHEWHDGVLAAMVRECSRATNDDKHWIVLDGPVDTYWIETLNSALDDSKKLCLANGQILQFTKHMTMIFEVENLEAASPAIVSRCGMIYMQEEGLSFRVLL